MANEIIEPSMVIQIRKQKKNSNNINLLIGMQLNPIQMILEFLCTSLGPESTVLLRLVVDVALGYCHTS